ncbi:MAG: NADPH:quinone reductase [Candidatus Riflebacteria bacterium]|nr:NADPH:quinone reductase [Candidatus Riflebacteria bacterium]
MKAIRVDQFGGPEVMRLTEMPIPQPGVGQVLIRLMAAGVNPVETYMRSGTYPQKPQLPYTPGYDGAGIVEIVGDQVTSCKPGDRVYTAGTISGSYAEYTLCNEIQIHPLPAKVSFAQGAAIGVPYATAFRALMQRARATPGEIVLIHGASGGVGTAAVQLALSYGLQVWGTAGTDRGQSLVMELGAHRVFDHGASDYADLIMQATKGHGINVILEMLANKNLAKDLTLLAPFGRVVVIGSRGPVEIDAREIMSRDADVRGMVLFNTSPTEMSRIHAALNLGLENGSLRPVISREIPLADAVKSHQVIMQPGASGKIVLIP